MFWLIMILWSLIMVGLDRSFLLPPLPGTEEERRKAVPIEEDDIGSSSVPDAPWNP